METFDYTFKVVVIGNAKVGKTNLVNIYIGKQFNVDTPSTIGVEFATKLVTTRSNKRVKLQLWDSGGNERYRVVAKSYYRGAQGYVLVYDVTDRASFLALEQFIREIKESTTEEVSLIIVGNKTDEILRVVTKEEGQEFANQHSALFLETSAKTGENVDLIFDRIIDMTISRIQAVHVAKAHEDRKDLVLPEKTGPILMDIHEERIDSQISKMDDVFGDLENMFNTMGHFLFAATCHRSHYEQESFGRKVLYWLPRFLPRVLVFLFLSVMSFLVILPSFFWLLVLRSKTVEVDSDKFEVRQDILQAESRMRRSVRWLSIALRSIPMNIFLVVLPILIVFVFIPLSTSPESRWRISVGLIGVYLLCVVAFQVLGTIRKSRSVEMQEAKTPPHVVRFRWQNYRNWIAILLLAVDFVQLITWPLQQIRGKNEEPVPQDEADSFFEVMRNSIFPAFFLNLSKHLFEVTFYFAVAAVLMLILLFTYQLMLDVIEFYRLKQTGSKHEANDYFFYSFVGTVVYGHGQLKNANNKICAAISFLADGAFLIVCNKLLMTIACSSTNSLLPDSDIVCWEGSHRGYAVVSLIMFAYYVPLCVMIAPIFMHSGQDEKDICFSESYMMTLTTMKCIMLIFSVFLSQTASGMISASVLVYFVLFIATMIWAIRAHNKFTEPSSFPFVNMFKIAGFFGALWCGCVALAAVHTGMEDAMLLLLSGAGVFGALIVLLFMWGGFNLRKNTMYVLADSGLAPSKHVELTESFTIE